jgi:hypothetical protein
MGAGVFIKGCLYCFFSHSLHHELHGDHPTSRSQCVNTENAIVIRIIIASETIGKERVYYRNAVSSLGACLKIRKGAVFGPRPGWRGATKENIPCGSSTEEQRSQPASGAKTLRAAGLLSVASVGSVLTARCGDARTSPPRPQPKSLVAAPFPIFRQALGPALTFRAEGRNGYAGIATQQCSSTLKALNRITTAHLPPDTKSPLTKGVSEIGFNSYRVDEIRDRVPRVVSRGAIQPLYVHSHVWILICGPFFGRVACRRVEERRRA